MKLEGVETIQNEVESTWVKTSMIYVLTNVFVDLRNSSFIEQLYRNENSTSPGIIRKL